MAATKKPRVARPHESPLQTLFVKRVLEEMEARGLNPYAMSRRIGGPKQKTLDDVLYGGAVPRITLIYQAAVALEVQPWELLRESDQVGRKHSKVVHLRTPPSVLGYPDREIGKSSTYKGTRRK